MFSTTLDARRLGRADLPSNSGDDRHGDDPALGKQGLVVNPYGCEHTAKAARAAVNMEFGCHGAALDHDDFADRKPWQMPSRNL